jgi:hypothetical protein
VNLRLPMVDDFSAGIQYVAGHDSGGTGSKILLVGNYRCTSPACGHWLEGRDHLRVAGAVSRDRDGQPRCGDCIRILALRFLDTDTVLSHLLECLAVGSLFRRRLPRSWTLCRGSLRR